MPVLVSCRECKRAVLISAEVTQRELDVLSDHLAACDGGGRSFEGHRAAILLRFRVAEIDRDRDADRAMRRGGRHVR